MLRYLVLLLVLFDALRQWLVFADDVFSVLVVLLVFLFPQALKAHLGIFSLILCYSGFSFFYFGVSVPVIAGLFFHFKFFFFYAVFKHVTITDRELSHIFRLLLAYTVLNFIVYLANLLLGAEIGNLSFYNGNLRFGSLFSNAGRTSALLVMLFAYFLFVEKSFLQRFMTLGFLLITFVKKDFWIIALIFGKRAFLALVIPSFGAIAYIVILEYSGQSFDDVARFLLWYYPITVFSQEPLLLAFGWGPGTWGGIVSGVFYSSLYYEFGLNVVWGMMPDHHSYLSDGNWASIFGEMGLVGVSIYVIILRRIFNDIRGINRKGLRHFSYTLYISLLIQSLFLVPFMTNFYYIGLFMIVPMIIRSNKIVFGK